MKKQILSIVALASLMVLGGCGNKTSESVKVPDTPASDTNAPITDNNTDSANTDQASDTAFDSEATVETAETRHNNYLTKQSDTTASITIQGKVIHAVSYSGSATYNIAVQEGIYGYWLNNVPKADIQIGKSYVFTGKGAKKSYPAINMKNGTVTETAAIETTTLTLGDASNSFEDSRNAYISIPEGGVTITSADKTNHKYGFEINGKTYYLSYNTSVTEAEALNTKTEKLGVGCKVSKLSGTWYTEDTVTLYSPDEIEFTAPDAASVTITASDDATTLQATGTLQLTAAVNPEAASQEVVWSSEKEDIATVDANGLVTGIKEGTTKIFATAKGTEIKGEISLTVTAAPSSPVESITITAADNATGADVGETLQLTTTILPSNAMQNVNWTSSDNEIATVDNTGLVTFVGDGDVTITATAADESGVKSEIKLSTIVKDLKTAEEIATLVKDLKNNAPTDKLSYRGVVTAIKDDTNFLIADGTGAIQAYNFTKAPAGMKVGDTLLFKGKMCKYNALIEITESNTTSLIISKKKVTGIPTEPTEMTKDQVIALAGTTAFSKGQYIKIKNAYAYKTGNYTNFNIEGTAVKVSPIAAKGVTFDTDTWGTFTGFVVSMNNNITLWIDSFTANESSEPATVTVSGKETVTTGKSITLTADVKGTSEYANVTNKAVKWSVANKDESVTDALATIDENTGVLTAGTTAGVVVVTATSVADSTKKGTFEVTISAPSTDTKKYGLITDIAKLQAGYKVVFAYDSGKTAYGMGAQSGTFRSKVDVTVTDNTIEETDGLYEFTVVAGYEDNTFAFFDGTNYLAYNGSANALHTATEVKAESSFKVTISEKGVAKIESCKTAGRFIQYNVSNPRFACYTSSQKSISIYGLVTKA